MKERVASYVKHTSSHTIHFQDDRLEHLKEVEAFPKLNDHYLSFSGMLA